MRLRRGRQQGSGKALAKGNDAGGPHMEAGKGGTGYVGPMLTAKPDQAKVAAMIASMKADAARAVSQRQPSAKSEGFAGKTMAHTGRCFSHWLWLKGSMLMLTYVALMYWYPSQVLSRNPHMAMGSANLRRGRG